MFIYVISKNHSSDDSTTFHLWKEKSLSTSFYNNLFEKKIDLRASWKITNCSLQF